MDFISPDIHQVFDIEFSAGFLKINTLRLMKANDLYTCYILHKELLAEKKVIAGCVHPV